MNENSSSDVQTTTAQAPAQTNSQPADQTKSAVTVFTASHYMQNCFLPAIQMFRGYNNRKTGYSNVDAVQPLYPGLYVLGAIPSLGKTTFAGQMADQIASTGTPVMFYSLEQSAFELYSKEVARKSMSPDTIFTAY